MEAAADQARRKFEEENALLKETIAQNFEQLKADYENKIVHLEKKRIVKLEKKVTINEDKLKTYEDKSNEIGRKLSVKIEEMNVQFKEFKEDEFSSSKREQYQKIDSKIDLLKSEVKEKLQNFETEISSVKDNVSKIEEKQKTTDEYLGIPSVTRSGVIGGISDKTIGNYQTLEDMRDYLDYNKEYNKKEQQKRIELKSKKELDNMIMLNEKMASFRNRESKSVEKSAITSKGYKRINLQDRNNFTFDHQNSLMRNSTHQLKQRQMDANVLKIPPIKNSIQKFTPKHLDSNIDFISLEGIQNQGLF